MVKARSGKAIVQINLRLPVAVYEAAGKALDRARAEEPSLSLNEWLVRAVNAGAGKQR